MKSSKQLWLLALLRWQSQDFRWKKKAIPEFNIGFPPYSLEAISWGGIKQKRRKYDFLPWKFRALPPAEAENSLFSPPRETARAPRVTANVTAATVAILDGSAPYGLSTRAHDQR